MKFTVLIFGILFALIASANPPESHSLYPDGVLPNESCSVSTVLTINQDNMTARLEERLAGVCDLYVAPNARTYYLSVNGRTAEGLRLHGIRRTVDGVDRLIIVDTRGASVPVNFPNRLAVTEMTTTGSRTLYSLPKQ